MNLIKPNGRVGIEDLNEIKKLIKYWYQNLYTIDVEMKECHQTRVTFLDLETKMREQLEEDLKREKIHKVVFDMAV